MASRFIDVRVVNSEALAALTDTELIDRAACLRAESSRLRAESVQLRAESARIHQRIKERNRARLSKQQTQ